MLQLFLCLCSRVSPIDRLAAAVTAFFKLCLIQAVQMVKPLLSHCLDPCALLCCAVPSVSVHCRQQQTRLLPTTTELLLVKGLWRPTLLTEQEGTDQVPPGRLARHTTGTQTTHAGAYTHTGCMMCAIQLLV